MTYLRAKTLVVIFIVVYFLISLSIIHSPLRRSIESPDSFALVYFPLYSWTIFMDVPRNEESYYTIRILSYNGITLESPVYFVDTVEFFDKSNKKMEDKWYKLFEQFAADIQSRRSEGIASARKEIEEGFLSDDVTYELVYITFEPLEFLRSRSVLSVKSLGVFKTLNN